MRFLERIRWIWVLIGWTLFLWLSRLRNVLNNDELSTAGRAVRLGVVVVFVSFAAVVAVAIRRRRAPPFTVHLVRAFLVWTFGYWAVRGIGILIDGDYSVGFKAVHTVLMVVSGTLSGLTARQEWPRG